MRLERTVTASDGTRLAAERVGPEQGPLAGAPPIVLLHGLTATRHYVLMGSRMLERAGCEIVSYDARGHGDSAPAASLDPAIARQDAAAIRNALAAGDQRAACVTLDVELELHEAYGYRRLARDLRDVLDVLEIDRAVLVGASMGAHTITRLALAHPERVAAAGLITPAFDPEVSRAQARQAYSNWDSLAAGLRSGGVEGFLAAYDLASVPEAWRGTVETVIRQRLRAHRHPEAVADALEAVPRSRPFETFGELAAIAVPVLVLGSRDEADPGHPLAVAECWAASLPTAELLVEAKGSSPIAWQGGQLSRTIEELIGRI
jgi:3-oxoadipate enol-lactonase